MAVVKVKNWNNMNFMDLAITASLVKTDACAPLESSKPQIVDFPKDRD